MEACAPLVDLPEVGVKYEVELPDGARQIGVRRADEGGWWVSVDGGAERLVQGTKVGTAEWLLTQEGVTRKHAVYLDGEHVYAQHQGHAVRGTVIDPRGAALAAGSASTAGEVSTPMPGVVVRVLVAEGDSVTEGQVLLVVEAMKMENEYTAAIDGTVATVHVAAGETVEANTCW